MGATVGPLCAGRPAPQFSRSRVVWRTAVGRVWAGVGLIPVAVVLRGLAPARHSRCRRGWMTGAMLLPWPVPSVFSVMGVLGWGCLVTVYVSVCVRGARPRAGLARTALGWESPSPWRSG